MSQHRLVVENEKRDIREWSVTSYDPTDFNSLVVLHVPPTGSYRTYLNVGMLATVHSAARLMMVFAES